MWIRTQGFHVPKRGHTESEYEDAFFPLQLCQYNLSKFHCAVADGASESVYSGEWARLLVRGYCRQRLSLESMQRCWLKLANSRPAPWYLEEKIRRGAHAALVGLSISAESPSKETLGGSWEAEAVGDSCFFHIRDDELLKVGPLCNSDEFNNNPHLIPSTASGSINDELQRSAVAGKWQPGDEFFLLTDALAQWALAEYESYRSPWPRLRLPNHAEDQYPNRPGVQPFEAVVNDLRENCGLHNDDTTLLRVEVA